MAKTAQKPSISRKKPLLPQTVGDTSNKGSKCSACGRFILLMFPILGAAMVITILFLLSYHLDNSVQDESISGAMADHEPYWEVVLPLSLGAFFIFIVTISRTIQIGVYHRRRKSEITRVRIMNFVAASANILAYVGFMLLTLYKIDGDDAEEKMHIVGACMYFGLGCLYFILHDILLLEQTHYPFCIKVVLIMITVPTVFSCILFGYKQEEAFIFEWIAVALYAIYVGLFSVLFYIDPADDEIRDFFFCRGTGTAKK
mmetsp:Transcript_17823/g.38550  ORF Transcript_17823/g.38550 Transcript_17823/m.38550 type:complete len:258 (+) Transcript_17823:113-886(+)